MFKLYSNVCFFKFSDDFSILRVAVIIHEPLLAGKLGQHSSGDIFLTSLYQTLEKRIHDLLWV